jgi:hypothetical protein
VREINLLMDLGLKRSEQELIAFFNGTLMLLLAYKKTQGDPTQIKDELFSLQFDRSIENIRSLITKVE